MLQILVAEVYGPDQNGRVALAQKIKDIFQHTPGMVDVDWYVEDPQPKCDIRVDLDKAALHGVSAADVTRAVQVALHGADAGLLHSPNSREEIPINVRLGRSGRSGIEDLSNIKLATATGGQVSLAEVTNINETTVDRSVYRKNMQSVVYVTGDLAG